MRTKKLLVYLFFFFIINSISGQDSFVDYKSSPREYSLAAIIIDGVVHLDHEMIIQKSGLVRGEKIVIPGEKISKAISNLWELAPLGASHATINLANRRTTG
jgi:outer membrane protein insertion porin family